MIDTSDDSWREIESYCKEAILDASNRVENRATDYQTTQYFRGQIAALRSVLNLPHLKPIEIIDSEDY